MSNPTVISIIIIFHSFTRYLSSAEKNVFHPHVLWDFHVLFFTKGHANLGYITDYCKIRPPARSPAAIPSDPVPGLAANRRAAAPDEGSSYCPPFH
jgi:hypothetical protein